MTHFDRSSRRRDAFFALALIVAVTTASAAFTEFASASTDDPLPKPTGSPSARPPAQELVDRGLALASEGKWQEAEADYRRATTLSRGIPEAWNGLGHALKMQRRFDEALAAYDEALRLRPSYPQALEYLGETYVAMGRYDDAEKTLARLRPLDTRLAAQLDSAIVGRTERASAW